MNTTAFCITGWHFPEIFFRQISQLSGVDYYVVSHKSRKQVPGYVFELVGEECVLFRPNLGYDWGTYQQFLKSGLWRDYQATFFMHDDIEIHDNGFVEATLALLKKHPVVGNGRGEGTVSYTGVNKHPYAYAHSCWKPADYTFQHHTVRGSYFATRRDVLEHIGEFEVYWDPFFLNIGFGNWSTKTSCGKLEYIFGPDCFGFLSDTFGRSQYITEFYRGDNQENVSSPAGLKEDLFQVIKKISIIYTETYYQQRVIPFRALGMLVMKLFLGLFSGRLILDKALER